MLKLKIYAIEVWNNLWAPGSICWKIAEDMDWRRSEKAKPKPKAM